MAVGFSNTNKPLNPRGNDASPKGYNRAALYSGKALDFDGVNDIISEQTISIDTTSFSVSVYAKGDALGSNSSLLSFGDNTTFDLILYPYDLASSGVRIYDKQIPGTLLDGVVAELGVYNMFTMQCDGEFLELYINGQFVKKSARTYSSTYTRIQFGKVVTISQWFNGQISNAKVFDVALTAAQVADLYNNPEKVVPTGVDNTALKLWLPMQEGAGTTAYDGSGNGNHGTISGATYVNGVGAPVSQTAVIDWNKGTNYVKQSEDFDNSDWSKITTGNGTLNRTPNYAEAPDGSQTATRVQATHDPTQATSYGLLTTNASTSTTGNYITGLWVKSNTGSNQNITMYVRNGIDGEDIVATSEWQRVTKRGSGSNNYLAFGTRNDLSSADTSIDILIWGASINYGTEVDSYVPTYGSGQENDVLLPQGLTSGRDITGVNLFENVRKQGALNLDGNSWAEVHDNESLDLSDANASFEAWVYHIDMGVVSQYIMNKFDGTTGVRVRTETGNNFGFYASDGTNNIADSGTFSLTANAWNHVVLTTDGTNFKRYINGALVDTDVAGTPLTTFANADSLYIGSEQTNASLAESRIAQPRIYNRALTAAEVLQNYNSGKNTYK